MGTTAATAKIEETGMNDKTRSDRKERFQAFLKNGFELCRGGLFLACVLDASSFRNKLGLFSFIGMIFFGSLMKWPFPGHFLTPRKVEAKAWDIEQLAKFTVFFMLACLAAKAVYDFHVSRERDCGEAGIHVVYAPKVSFVDKSGRVVDSYSIKKEFFIPAFVK